MSERFFDSHPVFCFDSAYNFRKQHCVTYKAHRKLSDDEDRERKDAREAVHTQLLSLRKKWLPGMGFANVFVQRGCEADDLIASICKSVPKGDSVTIDSSDNDLWQLLRNGRVDMIQKDGQLLTESEFTRIWGLSPKQWPEVKALAGCSSDNIIGIRGVGEKTAAKYLLRQLKRTSAAYCRITEGKDSIDYDLNLRLAALPYPGTHTFDLREDSIDEAKWNQVMRALGIRSLEY